MAAQTLHLSVDVDRTPNVGLGGARYARAVEPGLNLTS